MALAGKQTVHLAVTPDGLYPFSSSPFPPCGAITPSNPFPQSPTPEFALLTQNIIGGPAVYSSANFPAANCSIDVEYLAGSVKQQATIYVVETYATVYGAL